MHCRQGIGSKHASDVAEFGSRSAVSHGAALRVGQRVVRICEFMTVEILCRHGHLARRRSRAYPWLSICSILPRGRVPHGEVLPAQTFCSGGRTMVRLFAVLAMLASFLLVAPVIESGTSESTQIFQAIGTADGSGGGDWRDTRHRSDAGWDRARCPVATKGGFGPPLLFGGFVLAAALLGSGPLGSRDGAGASAGLTHAVRGLPPTARQRSRHARSAPHQRHLRPLGGGADLRRAGSVRSDAHRQPGAGPLLEGLARRPRLDLQPPTGRALPSRAGAHLGGRGLLHHPTPGSEAPIGRRGALRHDPRRARVP